MYGRKQKEKSKIKMIESLKEYDRLHPGERIRKISEWNINHPNRKFSSTSIELKIREELEKRGFRKDVDYYCNVGLCKIANVDIYLPAFKIVIECDGCYYHNCLDHFPNEHKETREADERKTRILMYNGFNVYRFWEHEINESAEKCIDKIKIQNYERFQMF